MITVDFKGEHKGVHLYQRGKDDLHICIAILTKKNNWSIEDISFSSSWIDEMIEQLKEASFSLKYKMVSYNSEFKGHCMGVQLRQYSGNCDVNFMIEDDGYWQLKSKSFPATYLDELIEQFEKANNFLKTQQPDMGTEKWQMDTQYGWKFDNTIIRKLKLKNLR